MSNLTERIDSALGAMARTGPRGLIAYLEHPAPDFTMASQSEIEEMLSKILSLDPNDSSRLLFSNLLRSWDNAKNVPWAKGTDRNTPARRKRIHELLKSDSLLEGRIDSIIPFYHLEEPLIISEQHRDWYSPQTGVRDYYWSTYVEYLGQKRGWDEALLDLDNSTKAIMECLADPESKEAYGSRGLVVGYVQSGKTANFAGVVARAADAGYRLIIVLAGTWNILRNQTQRRFDKELLGKELLRNDDNYRPAPQDWNEFLEHGCDPVELGHYTWQRLTRPDIDFRRLRAAIDNLEFEKHNRSLPLFNPENLHSLPVKLLVVKKHSTILSNLVKDLKLIRTRLVDLPTLIIDDESDQAGINTIDPRRSNPASKERSKTNQKIVQLLKLFPRGQYVGYTATPYANALVDPNDPEDLFPRDFIVSLDRPRGYMGISDFFDPATDFSDLDPSDWSLPEIAFIRRVTHSHGADDEDLKKAMGSFVLAGGLKIYRNSTNPNRYKSEHFKHHTMLVHTSSRKGEHASLASRIEGLWKQCAFNSPKGLTNLKLIWEEDYRNVCLFRVDRELVPDNFEELIPHLSEAIKRIEKGGGHVKIVNSDNSSAPDFSTSPVWRIIVGGNKLSRGYTIEGLTISYYRRVTSTADTLMQMGRWFGFRPGYQDLVRVYLGVNEGKKGDIDLVSLFKEVCRMEERFREEVKRYVRRPGVERITPKQVPPLISVFGNIPPTARNKMFNAVIASKNFGGNWSTPTLVATGENCITENVNSLGELLRGSKSRSVQLLGGKSNDGRNIAEQFLVFEVGTSSLLHFLNNFRWLESEYKFPDRPAEITLQAEFLTNKQHGIASWMVLAPQRRSSYGSPLKILGVGDLAVKERQRVGGRGFNIFGESSHHAISEYLLSKRNLQKIQLVSANGVTEDMRDKHRGIMLLYPVREKPNGLVSIGFELLFPENDLTYDLHFTVLRKADQSRVVVQASDIDVKVAYQALASDRGIQ